MFFSGKTAKKAQTPQEPTVSLHAVNVSTAPPKVKIKGGMTSAAYLRLQRLSDEDMTHLDAALEELAQHAQALIQGMPVVIELEQSDLSPAGLQDVVNRLRQAGANPFALRAPESQAALAQPLGISYLGELSREHLRRQSPANASEATRSEQSAESEFKDALIITTPIRSGQQVYARDRDLIVIGNVSRGAEILADGNIHVYGALRGRAMAGLKGNDQARIFCTAMDAELLLINGDYLTQDSVSEAVLHKPCQVVKDDQTIQILVF